MIDIEPQDAPTLAAEIATDDGLLLTTPNALRASTNLPPELTEPAAPGLETLWGFLLRTEPSTLYLMQNPIKGLLRDERRARWWSRKMGSPCELRPVTTQWLIEAGLREVGSYRPEVLEKVFPLNP
jgi:hypothetical protein